MERSAAALQLAYYIRDSRLGRRRLATQTGLTEMTVRIELERMRDRKLVKLERVGAELTSAGRRHYADLLERVVLVAPIELTRSLRLGDVALAARLTSGKSNPVWALRDAAVRGGASGLLLLRFGAGGWLFAHDGEPVRLRNPEDADRIDAAFPHPDAGDLLPIVFGPNLKQAGLALWHTVIALLSATL